MTVATGLVPERELLADDRILVDPRLDLRRSEDRRVARGSDRPACRRNWAASMRAATQAIMFESAHRHHRLEQEELGLRLAGHPHDDVVGLGREGLLARLAGRHGPQVVALEEALRVGDVVAAEHPGLDVEQLLGDPQVGQEPLGHGVHGLEQRREDAAVRPDDRVGRVGDVEVHRAVVGVHRDLDAVADVVDRSGTQRGGRQRRRGRTTARAGSGHWSCRRPGRRPGVRRRRRPGTDPCRTGGTGRPVASGRRGSGASAAGCPR